MCQVFVYDEKRFAKTFLVTVQMFSEVAKYLHN